MSTKKARESFKKIITLCLDEDYPELHKELISLQIETKKAKETYKYEKSIKELMNIIPVLAEDFPTEILSEIEEMYQELLEEN